MSNIEPTQEQSQVPRERRIGKFHVRWDVVEDYATMSRVIAIMGFVPVRVEALFAQRAFLYEGFSDKFYEVSDFDIIPEYDVAIINTVLDDGEAELKVTVERKE